MELEEAMKTLLDFIRCAEEEFGKVKYTSTSMNVDDRDIEAISTILQELDRLQKENVGKDCLIETLDHNEKVKDEYIKHLEEKTRNSISKDKIRKKIEEIESVYSKRVYDRKYDRDKVKAERFYKTEVLNDLLKEE